MMSLVPVIAQAAVARVGARAGLQPLHGLSDGGPAAGSPAGEELGHVPGSARHGVVQHEREGFASLAPFEPVEVAAPGLHSLPRAKEQCLGHRRPPPREPGSSRGRGQEQLDHVALETGGQPDRLPYKVALRVFARRAVGLVARVLEVLRVGFLVRRRPELAGRAKSRRTCRSRNRARLHLPLG